MNKGFFVAILGVVLGAMVLIFLNQASSSPELPPVVVQPAPVADASSAPGTVADTAGRQPSGRDAAPGSSAGNPGPRGVEQPAETPAPAAKQAVESVKPVQPAKPSSAQEQGQIPPTQEVAKAPEVKPAASRPAEPGPDPATVRPQAQPVPAAPSAPATPAAKTRQPGQTGQGAPEKTSQPVASPQPTNEHTPKKGVLTLRNIGLHFRDNGMALRIEADGPFSYKSFVLPKPERYVVDLVGNWSNMRAPAVPANLLIKGVRVGTQSAGPRLVLDLQRPLKKHDVVQITPTILEFRVQ